MMIFEHTVPVMLIAAALAGALAVLAFSFWRYVKFDLAAVALVALRVAFLALLAWCLLQPQRKVSLTHTLKPRFIVALDTSSSMLLSPSALVTNRWGVAREALRRPWREVLAADCDIEVYPFAAEVGAKIAVAEADALVPDGTATQLRDALKKLSDRYKGQNVTGMLLLSDGIDTREAYDDWTAEALPWPVYTVSTEPAEAWEVEPDLRVDGVKTPRRVTAGWTTELKALIAGQGTRGAAANVQLFKNDALLQEVPVQIPAEGGAKEVSFQLDHPEIGVFTYRVAVPPLPRESHTNDNAYAVSVQVVDTKNRLLHVEGAPRQESKFLMRALKANTQVTPISFLRGPNGKFLTSGPRGNLTTEMTEVQLAMFKIVILGDLDAKELGEERARNLLKFAESGGSLILLGGPKAWGENGLSKSPLQKLLPVKGWAMEPVEQKSPVALTDVGQSHAAFAGDPQLWTVVPPVLSYFPRVKIAAGAEALVAAATPDGANPIIVSHRYGQGKVVAVMTDSLWRWQLSPDASVNKPYQRFWDQMLAWLSPSEKEVQSEQVDLYADREQLYLGEAVELSARVGGKKGQPAAVTAVTCEITAPDKRKIPFTMAKQQVTTPSGKTFSGFAVKFTAETPGLFNAVAVTQIDGKEIKSDAVSFFVKPFTAESMPQPVKMNVLGTISRNSGGRFFANLDELNDMLSSLKPKGSEEESVRYETLWQTVLMICCLMALLSIDWAVRKWRNMP